MTHSPSSPPPPPSTLSSPFPVLRAFRSLPPDPGPSPEILAARWRDLLAAYGLPPDSTSQSVIQRFDRQGELLESLLPVSPLVVRPPADETFIALWGKSGTIVDVGLCRRTEETYHNPKNKGYEFLRPAAWVRIPDLSLIQTPPFEAPTSGA